MSYLRGMFRRSGNADRAAESRWSRLAADVLGPLVEFLWRVCAVGLLGSAIIPVLRGKPWADLFPRLLALAAGLAVLTLLASRIVRTTYVAAYRRWGLIRLVICPVAASFFLFDAAWLAFGVSWLVSSARTATPAGVDPDPAFAFGGPALELTVAVALLGLRIWARVRAG